MKMVKSLLLGSAAGLVAIAGAQAADLPVKAKPVQYVKICSLYGVGFYYIPGTDMCIKVGGWVRAEYGYGLNGSFAAGWTGGTLNSNATNNSAFRARGYLTADARNQSEYGTVRGYLAVGINTSSVGLDTAANQFSANRAFIQWAGFTFGLAQSFFDFYSVPATSYWGAFPASDTGDPGWFVMGYTAQFGNGFSATISAEQRRIQQIGILNATGTLLGAGTTVLGAFAAPGAGVGGGNVGAGGYGGFDAPDVVANLRVDQAWGSAQIMGALHQVNMTYFTGSATNPELGHADQQLGWAVGAGIKLNAPMIGQGDYLQAQVNYTQGALRYVFFTPASNWGLVEGNSVAFGVMTDAVVGGSIGGAVTPTSLELTTAWNVNAAYEHFWNPRWRTSLYGGYAATSYDSQANGMLCTTIPGNGAIVGGVATANPGCDMNWQTWWIGSRTQWNVTKDFYMGVDVLYAKLQSASLVDNEVRTGITTQTGVTTVGDHDNWMFRFRVHRDFYP